MVEGSEGAGESEKKQVSKYGNPSLGGSWLLRRVISRIVIVIAHIKGLITPLFSTHEPASRP